MRKRRNSSLMVLAFIVAVLVIVFASPVVPQNNMSPQAYLPAVMHNYPVVPQNNMSPQAYLPAVMHNYEAPIPPRAIKYIGATYLRSYDTPVDCSWLEKLPGVQGFYNWGPNPRECPGYISTPMVWNDSVLSQIISGTATIGGNDDWLMGPNEPEYLGQADMTPFAGAVAHRELEVWLEANGLGHMQLLSASVNNLWWLEDMRNDYLTLYKEPPRINAIGVHCYGAYDAGWSLSHCRNKVTAAIALAEDWSTPDNEVEVWVTEWALVPCWQGGYGQSVEFMVKFSAWLQEENQVRVTRSYFFQLTYEGTELWGLGTETWSQKAARVCSQYRTMANEPEYRHFWRDEFEEVEPNAFGLHCNTSLLYFSDGVDPWTGKLVIAGQPTPLCSLTGEYVEVCQTY